MASEDAIDSCVAQIAGMVHDRGKLIHKPPSRQRVYYACDMGRPGRDETAFIRATWDGGAYVLEQVTEQEYIDAVPRLDAAPPGGERKAPATTVPAPRDRLPEGSYGARLCQLQDAQAEKRGPKAPIEHKSLFD